jgi:pentose-5-phosphate-3-epimerase
MMICNSEIFLDMVDGTLVELTREINALTPKHPELDIIHTQMVVLCSKMLKAFMKNGNERILVQVEQLQDLMRIVRSKQNATAM